MNLDSLVLTRYLYNKEKVLDKLEECILSVKEDESYFWAYEIYFSFLEIELFERLFLILKTHYSGYPRLYKYLFKRYTEWKEQMEKNDQGYEEDNLHMIIAVFIKNIIIRKRDTTEPKLQLYITIPLNKVFLNDYKTNLGVPPRNSLKINCKYSLFSFSVINKIHLAVIISNQPNKKNNNEVSELIGFFAKRGLK